jgi:5-methyltetrahydrofolate--homocysteine methyltransferase
MKRLNFTEQDWERVEDDTLAWWAGELERPLVYLSVTRWQDLTELFLGYMSNYPLEMPVEQVLDRYSTALAATDYYADAFPWLWVNFGPGIVAGFLGCNVNSVAQPSETVWFTPLNKLPVNDLNLEYQAENIWWKRVKELTAGLVERYGPDLAVSHTDLGGNMDILASFRETEGLLFDVVEASDQIDRLTRQITHLWLRYYDELDEIIRPTCRGTSCWTPIWSPGKTYMLQSDFSYMISPAMFERFVAPDISACCDHLDHGFYHLDGKGQIPHLDQLLAIPRLRGIQWIPGDGQPTPDQWLPLLKRIRDGGKLCQVFVTPRGARHIVRNLGGHGFLFVIENFGRDFDAPAAVEGFLSTLESEDINLVKRFF